MNKQKGNVGVELEFPLINMEKKPVSLTVAQNLLDSFLEKGFKAEETTIDGKNAFISNDAGDVLSFDNSYNNFEFSMNYGPSLCDIAERFCRYFTHANSFALKHNHILTGMGTNPYKKYTLQHHVNFPVYNMVDEYLHTFPAKHNFRLPLICPLSRHILTCRSVSCPSRQRYLRALTLSAPCCFQIAVMGPGDKHCATGTICGGKRISGYQHRKG